MLKLFHKLFLIYLCQLNVYLISANTNSTPVNFIIKEKVYNGDPVSIANAPWQVSIRLKALEEKSFGNGQLCGGALISQRVVITSGQCVVKQNVTPRDYYLGKELLIVMGSSYLYEKTMHTQSYDVMKVLANPGFELALLFINGDIPKDSRVIMPIQFNKVEQKPGTKCNLTSWSRSTNNLTTLSSVLTVNKMRLESNVLCSTYYANSSANTFCAENLYGPGAVCQGDIGAPLVCNGTLVGITNWNAVCNANSRYPPIFANISNYYTWIVHANSTLDYTQYRNAAIGLINNYNLLGATLVLLFLLLS